MEDPLTSFYLAKLEPYKSAYLCVRDIIIDFHPDLKNEWKFQSSFFTFKGKMICYFGFDKKRNEIYLGFVKGISIVHSALESGSRKQIKILSFKADEDLPRDTILEILKKAISLY